VFMSDLCSTIHYTVTDLTGSHWRVVLKQLVVRFLKIKLLFSSQILLSFPGVIDTTIIYHCLANSGCVN